MEVVRQKKKGNGRTYNELIDWLHLGNRVVAQCVDCAVKDFAE